MSEAFVLIGKLGHGKTHVFNRLCGTNYPSTMAAGSCTRENVEGCTLKYNMRVIDTPGFGSSHMTGAHIHAQRTAVESNRVSGIFAVVKYGAVSDMAQCLNHLMDFVGIDDIRIIVTHVDNPKMTVVDKILFRNNLSILTSVARFRIILIGKEDPDASTLEDFLWKNQYFPARQFAIEPKQLQFASFLTVGVRRFTKELNDMKRNIEIASDATQKMINAFGTELGVPLLISRVKTSIIDFTNHLLNDMQKQSLCLSPEEQRILRCKIQNTVQPALEKLGGGSSSSSSSSSTNAESNCRLYSDCSSTSYSLMPKNEALLCTREERTSSHLHEQTGNSDPVTMTRSEGSRFVRPYIRLNDISLPAFGYAFAAPPTHPESSADQPLSCNHAYT